MPSCGAVTSSAREPLLRAADPDVGLALARCRAARARRGRADRSTCLICSAYSLRARGERSSISDSMIRSARRSPRPCWKTGAPPRSSCSAIVASRRQVLLRPLPRPLRLRRSCASDCSGPGPPSRSSLLEFGRVEADDDVARLHRGAVVGEPGDLQRPLRFARRGHRRRLDRLQIALGGDLADVRRLLDGHRRNRKLVAPGDRDGDHARENDGSRSDRAERSGLPRHDPFSSSSSPASRSRTRSPAAEAPRTSIVLVVPAAELERTLSRPLSVRRTRDGTFRRGEDGFVRNEDDVFRPRSVSSRPRNRMPGRIFAGSVRSRAMSILRILSGCAATAAGPSSRSTRPTPETRRRDGRRVARVTRWFTANLPASASSTSPRAHHRARSGISRTRSQREQVSPTFFFSSRQLVR